MLAHNLNNVLWTTAINFAAWEQILTTALHINFTILTICLEEMNFELFVVSIPG
jgi:hypothetical protein